MHFDLLYSTDNYHALGRLFYVQRVNYISLFFSVALRTFLDIASYHGSSRSQSDKSQSLGLLRTRDHPDAETSA